MKHVVTSRAPEELNVDRIEPNNSKDHSEIVVPSFGIVAVVPGIHSSGARSVSIVEVDSFFS